MEVIGFCGTPFSQPTRTQILDSQYTDPEHIQQSLSQLYLVLPLATSRTDLTIGLIANEPSLPFIPQNGVSTKGDMKTKPASLPAAFEKAPVCSGNGDID